MFGVRDRGCPLLLGEREEEEREESIYIFHSPVIIVLAPSLPRLRFRRLEVRRETGLEIQTKEDQGDRDCRGSRGPW